MVPRDQANLDERLNHQPDLSGFPIRKKPHLMAICFICEESQTLASSDGGPCPKSMEYRITGRKSETLLPHCLFGSGYTDP